MRWHLWQLSLNVFKCPTNRLQKLYGLFIYYKLKVKFIIESFALRMYCILLLYSASQLLPKQLHTFVHVHVRPS